MLLTLFIFLVISEEQCVHVIGKSGILVSVTAAQDSLHSLEPYQMQLPRLSSHGIGANGGAL